MPMMTVAEPIDADTRRIRHEFLTLPELRASVDCFALLLNVPMRHALLTLESRSSSGVSEFRSVQRSDGSNVLTAVRIRGESIEHRATASC